MLNLDLYLIRPPPGAKHSAIDPKHMVIAGDSAGGNLTLSLLTLIRDLNLPMPAGATLISPWVDMTHSFPSVMDNTKTVSG
jgi:acetyl esterase/lipase